MKALQALAIVSFALVLFAPAAGAADISSPATFEAASCLIGGDTLLPTFMLPVEMSWGLPSLPSCFNIEGTYCSTSGLPGVRCMWQAGEPGICFCNNNTMICG